MQAKDCIYLISLLVAIAGWFVSALIVYRQHRRTQLCNSIDNLRSAVITAENAALQFWVQNNTSVYYYQLQILVTRVSKLAQEAHKIDNSELEPPNHLLWRFRHAVTLNADNPTANRPIDINDKRAMDIMRLSGELQYYFEKPL